MRIKDEEGQAIVLVALAMSIFLIGAVGLGFDGSILYSQRQIAQMAADAAAQAGMMSIFDGTNVAGATGFSTSGSFTCGTTDARTPCQYASMDGVGGSPGDTVTVSFPADSAAPGVSFSNDTVHLIQVSVSRSVRTTLMRILGPTATTVTATAMAAIVSVDSPIPVIITHPTLSSALTLTAPVTICGGPSRSIQINSTSPSAVFTGGSSSIDLSHAGPLDPGNCTTGTGADFGIWGGSGSSPPGINYGAAGKYVQPASPILDPLSGVSPPPIPSAAPAPSALAKGVNGCPASSVGCTLYSPGLYTSGINIPGSTQVVFKPGIYYIQSNSGMSCSSCGMYMATGLTDPGTGWTGNMLVYNTGAAGSPANAGAFNIATAGSINLMGSPRGSAYKGILFFQDRNSATQSHSLGALANLDLVGTIYLANQYQSLAIVGHAGSSTTIQGDVIAGTLNIGGNSGITIDLDSTGAVPIRQVAMVN